MKLTFLAHSPFVKKLRTDSSHRVELDVPDSEYENFIPLTSPALNGINLKVTVEIDQKEEPQNDEFLPVEYLEKQPTFFQDFFALRAVYCKKTGLDKDAFNEKFLQGAHASDMTEEELQPVVEQIRKALKSIP